MGQTSATARMYLETVDPTVNDDEANGYEVGNFWLNNSTLGIWQCTDQTTGAAVWQVFAWNNQEVIFAGIENDGYYIGAVTNPGAYPYTVLSSDYFINVDTSSAANTITLEASPVAGRVLIIKDGSGNASTYNITISGNGNNIDGTTPQTISADYQSISIIFNGTEWSIF